MVCAVRNLFLALILVNLVSCGGKGAGKAGFAMPPADVVFMTMKPESVAIDRELPGRTSAFKVAEVRPQVNGIIRRRLFEEGAAVRAGQPLYQIDDAIYQAAYQSAKAALTRAEAVSSSAQINADRAAALAKIDAVSSQERDDTAAALAQAKADVAAARANVTTASTNLSYTRVLAPIAGRIGKSMVTEGALVAVNQPTALAVIQQLDPLYVDIAQSSNEWLGLRQAVDQNKAHQSTSGSDVDLVLEDGSKYAHPGKLQFSDVTVDPSTGTLLLRMTVPNPEHLLLPGMYVRGKLKELTLDQAILVPQSAVARDPTGKASVMIVNASNKVEARPVEVTRNIGNRWLIDSGLAAGDRVIVDGLQKVHAGSDVHATEGAPSIGAASAVSGSATAPATAAAGASKS